MTRVSVLMPCFNAASYVSAAIESVLAQTWTDLELIVVDDGSTDESWEAISAFSDPRVQAVRQKNAGQCAAANRAFELSSGSFIKFFDADDLLHARMLERQLSRIGHLTNAVALGEYERFFEAKPNSEAKFQARPMYRDARPVDWLASEWRNAQPMMQCALWLIPRPVLERSGLWDERLSLINDFEFFTRVLLSAEEILYAPGARLHYRSAVPGSLSGQKSRSALESALLSLELGTGRLLRAEDSARTRMASANLFRNFDYEHYPNHPDLRARARARAEALGGGDLEPIGSPNFHRARRLVGWRAARLVEKAARRIRAIDSVGPRATQS